LEHALAGFQHQATSRGQGHAVATAHEQGQAAALLEQAQAGAGRRHRDGKGRRRLAQAAGGGNRRDQTQVGQIEMHGAFSRSESHLREIAILAAQLSSQNNSSIPAAARLLDALTATYQRSLDDGVLFAVLSATGFSLKASLVKLADAAAPVDAVTVLSLRMGLALPLFAWLLWWSRGSGQVRLSARDWVHVLLLGMFGYYLSSLFDFYGLQYISAGLERLILFTYPTLVLLLQMLAMG